MKLIQYRSPELGAWSPFDRLSSFRNLLDSAFNLAVAGGEGASRWAPALDLYESDAEFTLQLELAGMKKDDFDIALEGDVLTVSGQRKDEQEGKRGESFRSERFFGAFRRSLTLPTPVQGDKVHATYENGVLTIVLPKAEEAKPKKIDVAVK